MFQIIKSNTSSPLLKKLSKTMEKTSGFLNDILIEKPNISDESLIHFLQKQYPKAEIFYNDETGDIDIVFKEFFLKLIKDETPGRIYIEGYLLH